MWQLCECVISDPPPCGLPLMGFKKSVFILYLFILVYLQQSKPNPKWPTTCQVGFPGHC